MWRWVGGMARVSFSSNNVYQRRLISSKLAKSFICNVAEMNRKSTSKQFDAVHRLGCQLLHQPSERLSTAEATDLLFAVHRLNNLKRFHVTPLMNIIIKDLEQDETGLKQLSVSQHIQLIDTLVVTYHLHENIDIINLQSDIVLSYRNKLNAHSIASTVSLFSMCAYNDVQVPKLIDFLDIIATDILRMSCTEFSNSDLVSVVTAFSRAHMCMEVLTDRFVKEILARGLQCFEVKDLRLICWTLARSNQDFMEFFDALADEFRAGGRLHCVDSSHKKGVISILWATAVATKFKSDIVADAMLPVCVNIVHSEMSKRISLPIEALTQLRTALVVGSLAKWDDKGKIKDYKSIVSSFTQHCEKNNPNPHVSSTLRHKEVVVTLKLLGVVHQCEVPIHGGIFIADILLHINDQPVVVEYDGLCHFFANMPRRTIGVTAFKRRLLTKLGYRVLSIPYWAWPGTKRERCLYMKRRLGC